MERDEICVCGPIQTPKKQTAFGVSAKRSKSEMLLTPDKSSSHHLSYLEIGGDNPCSRQLSEKVRLVQILSGLLPSGPSSGHNR
jgi:hypothetical protein